MLVSLLPGYLAHPEIWPPDGRLNPNNYIPPPVCQYVQEVVEVAALEETCTTQPVEECNQELVQRKEERTETRCEEVEEEQCEEVEDVEEEEVCEEEECDAKEKCHTVSDEKCETEYKSEVKEECSYSTVIDHKCSRSYEVSYKDSCTTQLQCSLLGLSCSPVDLCKKVPSLPQPVTCHRVPRQVGPRCRPVPVKRPVSVCRNVERQVCSQVECQPKQVCNKVLKPVVRQQCGPVTRKQCQQVTTSVPVQREETVCKDVPKKTCTNKEVTRPKLVNKRVCRELSDQEDKEEEQLTSYVNLENLG